MPMQPSGQGRHHFDAKSAIAPAASRSLLTQSSMQLSWFATSRGMKTLLANLPTPPCWSRTYSATRASMKPRAISSGTGAPCTTKNTRRLQHPLWPLFFSIAPSDWLCCSAGHEDMLLQPSVQGMPHFEARRAMAPAGSRSLRIRSSMWRSPFAMLRGPRQRLKNLPTPLRSCSTYSATRASRKPRATPSGISSSSSLLDSHDESDPSEPTESLQAAPAADGSGSGVLSLAAHTGTSSSS
mmetsp:Transcript_99064/g.251505  ORF Transcript_99064/g.251505 Transcript_99064/m.251505 type:complete len:240 (-) Transcript_99064:296-1015(-)